MMFQTKQRVLILLEIPLILVILCQLWYKPFPVWVYLLASVLLGLIIAISLHAFSQRRVFIFLQLLILAVLVRNVYYMATHYSVIPLSDAYAEYGAMRAYLEQGRVFTFSSPGGYSGWLTGYLYSGWPGLQLLAIPLSRICNIAPFNITLILPWIFFLGTFIFAYLLLTNIQRDLHLSNRATNFALLVMVTFPFFLLPPMFIHQDMATFLLMAIFYLLYKQLMARSARHSALLIVLMLTLIVTHHYTPFMVVAYLFLFSLLIFVGSRLSTRVNWSFLPRVGVNIPFLMLGMIAVAVLYTWWSIYAVWIWPRVADAITRTIEAFKLVGIRPPTWEVQYPAHLIPGWAPPLLLWRDIAMFVPAIAGFILLFRLRTADALSKVFIVYSLVSAAVLFSYDTFVARMAYYRVLFLFAPFVALCIAISYDKLYEVFKGRWRYLSTGLVVAVVVLFVFSSLTGQWAHRFTLAHFYDPEVNWREAGEHSTRWREVGEFLDDHMNYEEVDKVVTDGIYNLSLALPVGQLEKIQAMQLKGADITAETIVVAFRDLRLEYQFAGYPHWLDPEFEESKFRQELEENCNLIYCDGWSKVWRLK